MTTGRAVIFDFDGVLADSESLHFQAFAQTLASRGWSLSKDEYDDRFLGYSDKDVFVVFARERGVTLSAKRLASLLTVKGRVYGDLIATGSVLYPGAERLVRRLAGHFALGIASGSFSEEIDRVLESAGLRTSFAAVVGAGDVAASKPSPAPYLEAAKRLGVPPGSCVAIEDSPWGLESAQLAGLRTIGITHSYPAARLTAADRIVTSLDEISPPVAIDLLGR